MEIAANGLWAAAAVTAKRSTSARVGVGWAVCWAAFPDMLAFGPHVVAGLWLRLAAGSGSVDGHVLPHVHVGLPLYPAGHTASLLQSARACKRTSAHQRTTPEQ